MRIGNIDSPDIIDTTCEVVYDSGELSSTAASITITGLSGNSDKEYRLICRFIGSGAVGDYKLTFNTDTAANYGHQEINGVNATAAAVRNTSIAYLGIGNTGTTAYQSFSDTVIYAKSGKVRTALSKYAYDITGTTVTGIVQRGYSWNNTVDNITQMVITPAANLIGIGSRIILLKKRELTSGTKTGEIDPQGTTYGHWQLIYDNTLTAAKTNLMLSSQMDSYTKLLIHADGADTSTAFYDFSNDAKAITTNGNAQVDTAQSKFGGASALFDGTTDWLSTPNSTDFNAAGGAYTVDFWVRWNNVSSPATTQGLVATCDAGPTTGWGIWIETGKIVLWETTDRISYSWTPTASIWYHVAFCYDGTTTTLYIDGTSVATTSAATWNNDGNALVVGWDGDTAHNTHYLNGWIDELRISKGIARWTANFTPPTRAYNELDGDRDVVYRMTVRGIKAGTTNYRLYLNDNTSDVYGRQHLDGTSTTVSAARVATGDNLFYLDINGGSASDVFMTNVLLYSKSGFVRPLLQDNADTISGTTVTRMRLSGQVYNDVTNKLTSMRVGANSNTIGIGTHVSLWRLNL